MGSVIPAVADAMMSRFIASTVTISTVWVWYVACVGWRRMSASILLVCLISLAVWGSRASSVKISPF